MKKSNYGKFAILMATSFIILFAVVYMNAGVFNHVVTGHTRAYMTILMIAPMAFTMLLFMWGIYVNKKTKFVFPGLSVVVFISALAGWRQRTSKWIKVMIRHHSFAIMVSQNVHLKVPEAIELAAAIIEAQKWEIAQMKKMIYRLEQNNE